MDTRFIYWKIEHSQARWNCIVDTPENRQQALNDKAMFFTWAQLSEPYQNNGHEPHRWGDLPLDFDSKGNVETALREMQVLCLDHLPKQYGINPQELQFWISGGKGFHAVIPAHLLGAEQGDPHLPLVYREMVSKWKKGLSLSSLDMSLYCMKRGKMFRIENVRRSNGWYKVRLTLEEIIKGRTDDLLQLSTAPRILETLHGTTTR